MGTDPAIGGAAKRLMLNDPDLARPAVSLTAQICAVLRAEIMDGLWIGRADFPGEEELAKRFGVSVITSRRALERLTREGFVDRARGRRSRVTKGPEKAPRSAQTIFPTGGTPFEYVVLWCGVDVATAEACDAFERPHGSRLWQVRRLRTFEGRPHSVSYNTQSLEVGYRHTSDDLGSLSMGAIFRKAGYKPSRLLRRAGVARPTIDVARALGLALDEPILIYTFVLKDIQDSVLEWVRIYCHPNELSPTETIDFSTGEFIVDEESIKNT